MTRDDILAALKSHWPELRRRVVSHAAVFGSLARGDAGPKSDIDVLEGIASHREKRPPVFNRR